MEGGEGIPLAHLCPVLVVRLDLAIRKVEHLPAAREARVPRVDLLVEVLDRGALRRRRVRDGKGGVQREEGLW